jgi:F0F1-type ATP synthase assembly protein I
MESLFNSRINVTIGTCIVVLLFLLIKHYSGGVVTHHLLGREDLPGISNWWGLVTVPLLAWIVSTLIIRRKNKKANTDRHPENFKRMWDNRL